MISCQLGHLGWYDFGLFSLLFIITIVWIPLWSVNWLSKLETLLAIGRLRDKALRLAIPWRATFELRQFRLQVDMTCVNFSFLETFV